jgi:hypothetical protein
VLCLCSALAVALPARPPSVTIGALFTFDSVIGSSAATAIRLAVDDINRDATLLRGTNLSVLMQDTKCSGFVGTIQGRTAQLSSCPSLLPSCCSVLFNIFFFCKPTKSLPPRAHHRHLTSGRLACMLQRVHSNSMSLSPLGISLSISFILLLCSFMLLLLLLFSPSNLLRSSCLNQGNKRLAAYQPTDSQTPFLHFTF